MVRDRKGDDRSWPLPWVPIALCKVADLIFAGRFGRGAWPPTLSHLSFARSASGRDNTP